MRAERELPVVWAVALGSLRNKVILVPSALLISALAPWAILPLLMLGGLYLCFEGCEKLLHRFLHSPAEDRQHHAELIQAVADPAVDMVAFEREKIRGAIRTDFILSAEIIVITLGAVAGADFTRQLAVLVSMALLMTVGVYGLVAGIVKLDDFGLQLSARPDRLSQAVGHALLRLAPHLMKFLSVAGTVAMFLVGGGIVVHGIAPLHHAIEWVANASAALPAGGVWAALLSALLNGLAGMVAGALVLAGVEAARRWRRTAPSSAPT